MGILGRRANLGNWGRFCEPGQLLCLRATYFRNMRTSYLLH